MVSSGAAQLCKLQKLYICIYIYIGLVILLKLDSNHRLISPFDLEIWWMTSENNKASLLYYIKICASFQIHWLIQTGVTVRKRSIRVKIGDCLPGVTLTIDGWPWQTTWHIPYAASSFVHHFTAIGIFKLELESGIARFGSKLVIFLFRVTLKIDGWPLLYNVKLRASFQIHQWSRTWVTVRKRSIRIKIGVFFVLRDLEI